MRHIRSGSGQLIVAVFLFLSVCLFTSNALAVPTKSLNRGAWSLVSIPADPGSTGTVQAVFGDDLPIAGYGINWLVYGFDSNAVEYRLLALNERMEANRGYWVFQSVADTVEIDVPEGLTPLTGSEQTGCPAGRQCASVALSSNTNVPLWNAVGFSSDSEALFGDTRFVTASGVCSQGCTPAEAQSANVAQSVMFALNSDGSAYEVISEDTPMRPWDGYWLLVLPDADQLRWVVPVESATPPVNNQQPVAVDDTAGPLVAGNQLAVAVTTNDTDADGQIVASTVQIVEPPSFGSTTVTADGVILYSHSGAAGTVSDTFTYTVEDNSGAVSNVATVTISPINDLEASVLPELTNPLPGTQLSSADVTLMWDNNGVEPEQWFLRVGLSEGSTEFAEIRLTDPATMEYQLSGLPTNGVPVFVEFSFRENGVWNTRNFVYQAFDSSTVNQAPLASDDSAGPLVAGESITVDVLANDTDADGTVDPATVAIVSQPSAGTVSVETDGQVSYSHDGSTGTGSDSFTYTVLDNDGAVSNEATVSIAPITDPGQPVLPALTDPLPGTQLSGADVTFLWDDNGVELEQWFLRVGLSEGSAEFAEVRLSDPATRQYQVSGLPTNGAPVFVEFSFRKDGVWTVQNFGYTAFDDSAPSPEDIVLNDDTAIGFLAGEPVVGNVAENDEIPTDAAQQGLVFAVTVQAENGIATIDAETGAFEYSPDNGFNGNDSFTYSLLRLDDTDNSVSLVASARVNIRFDMVILAEDSLSAVSGVVISSNVASNDSLPENAAGLGLRLQVIEQPVNGSVDMDPIDGSYDYVSDRGYFGSDNFVYGVAQVDQNEQVIAVLAQSTVNVDVEAIAIEDDQFSAVSGQAISAVVSGNDTLPQAAVQGLVLRVTAQPENGSVDMNPLNGAFTYVSSDTFTGADTFTYALIQVDQQGTEIGVTEEDASVTIEVVAPVTIYKDFDYQGASWSATVGSYPDLSDTPTGNDQISSIRIAPGFSVRACTSVGFTGECNTYLGDVSRLIQFNDSVSSVQVSQLPTNVSSSNNGSLDNYRVSGFPGVVTGDTVMPGFVLENDQGFVVTQMPTRGAVFMSATGNYLYTPGAKFTGTDAFQYALVRFDQFGGIIETLAEAFIILDYAEGVLFFESELASFDNTIGTYELDASGNPVNLRVLLTNTNSADYGSVLGNFNGLPRLLLIADTGGEINIGDTLTWDGNSGVLVNGSSTTFDVIWADSSFNSSGLDLVRYQPTSDGDLLIGIEDQIGGGDQDLSDAVLRLNFVPAINSQ